MFIAFIVDRVVFLYVLLMFLIGNLLYSSVASSYKLSALPAGINDFAFFFYIFHIIRYSIWKLDFIFLNSIFWTMCCKSLSNWNKPSFLGGVLTDLNPKLVVISSLSRKYLSKKNPFHLILFIKLSTFCVRFLW